MKAITEIVLFDLLRVCKCVREREDEFTQMYFNDVAKKNNKAVDSAKNELKRIEARSNEIDEIIRKLYEDNVRGRITDDRFDILAKGYETEKTALTEKAAQLRETLQAVTDDSDKLENFKRLVRRYTEITELNTEILNAFIEKIYVGETVKTEIPSKRKRKKYRKTRTIRIIYKFIGAVDL